MNNETKRRYRINQIFLTIHDTGNIEQEMLISDCSMKYGLSRRTTREYINDLKNCKYIREKEGILTALKKPVKQAERREKEFESLMKAM